MNKHYNSSSSYGYKVGKTLPFLVGAAQYRIEGAEVINKLVKGEKIAAGTPIEYSLENNTAKFLKAWKVKSTTVSGDKTKISLYRTAISPEVFVGSAVMVAPEKLEGKGKACAVSEVEKAEGVTIITVDTASIDEVKTGSILVEAEGAGASKGMYCQPRTISTEDIIAGDNYTLVDIPYGILHAHKNCCNEMPACVKIDDSLLVVWEMFNEVNQ